jgi:hypothetical protein
VASAQRRSATGVCVFEDRTRQKITIAYNPQMGSTGEHEVRAGDADPDARWRPGFEAGSTVVSEMPEPAAFVERVIPTSPSSTPPSTPGAPVLGPDPWSRAAAERADDWLDELRRTRPRRSERSRPIIERSATPSVDGLPASAVSGEVGLAAVAVSAILVLAAVAVGVLIARLPSNSTESVSSGLVLPRQAEQLWTDVFESRVDEVDIGGGTILLRTSTELVASDGETGEELWIRPLWEFAANHEVFMFDSAAVVVEYRGNGPTFATGLDLQTGEVLWSRDGFGENFWATDRFLYELSVPNGQDGPTFVLRDPLTGDPLSEEIDIAFAVFDAPTPYVVEVAGDGRLVVHDFENEGPDAVPVAGFGIRDLAPVGAVQVGFDDRARIVAFDSAGERTDERAFVSGAFGDFEGRAEFVGGVPGHNVGIVSSGTSMGFEIRDGLIETLWELPGRVGPPVSTEIGPISVARLIDQATGEVDLALIDPVDGSVMVVTDVGETREADPIVAANGYLLSPAIGPAVRELSAVGFDGSQWWSVVIPQFGSYVVDDETLVVIERIGGTSTVTMYG